MERKGTDHHQSAMDHMTGAIGRLLPKLGKLLKQERNLQITTTPIYIKSLERQLRRMEDHALASQDATATALVLPTELRELAYDIEDIVDVLMLPIDQGKQVRQPIINQDSFNRNKTLIKYINVRVNNLAAWHAANLVPTTIRTVEPCLEDGFKQVREPVGIHKSMTELISRMSLSSQRLKIVSIWGAEGMGKTTLAKAVYENIKRHFQCTAFISVGPQPDSMKKALKDILLHLYKKRYYIDLNMAMLDEGQLIDKLRHFLEKKSFLIVIDDIRDIPLWEVIKCALVDSDCGSRIITTSRGVDVAQSSGEVLELSMPLSIDGSKELFYDILRGRKDTINYDAIDEQTTEYILQKCGCVPLAIVMISSLMAHKAQEEWTKVYNSIGFAHKDNVADEDNTRKIIQFSYYDLPSHLKTCLLYLSIFPDDHVIETDTLVWRWVAEGFVHDDEEHGESLFKVGKRYLHDLVSRSMIQAVKNEDTNIFVCRVQSMVLDWIRTVAEEENFVNIASGDWYDHYQHCQSSNARIMAVHNHNGPLDDLARMWKQKVRSFNATDCSISSPTLLRPIFQALRVLSLEGCKLTAYSDGLKNLFELLLHLRYLGLRGTYIENLPIGIGGLRYLQTLDLTDTYIRALPSAVTQLRQLKCLWCSALHLAPGMGNLTLLEELRLVVVNKTANVAKELSKLTELRVLHIVVYRKSFSGKWMKALVESLSKLQKLEELELVRDGPSGDMICRHAIAPGAFPKMRYFRTNTWLMYQPGAMPRLKSVELQVPVRALKDANFDFHELFSKLRHLRLLEKAHVGIDCRDAETEEAEEVDAALKHAVQRHPNRPTLVLNRVGRCVEDKQIRSFGGLHGCRLAPQVMPLELLRKITNDFSDKQKLGSGTFGTVYKGVLNGQVVAVKLLRHHSIAQKLDYEEEFMKEFENVRRLNHPNIVQLLGFCYETKRVGAEYEGKYILADEIDRALCFDYMHNGNLRRHLDDESHGMDWQTRYKIIKGTCEGLKYLHKGLETPMLHLDLKPENILLDKNMVPKLADFGLSKLVNDNQTRETSSPLGTIGYCPPEHIESTFFSDKFDIFSLGVIMIEIIAGPKGYGKADEMGSQGFIDHVQGNWRKRIRQVTPGCTSPNSECFQVKRCIEIALDCVHPKRMQRPDIEDIISRLNETENNTEESATTSSSQNET